MGSFWKDLGGFLVGEGVSTIKKKVDKTIKNVEERIEVATKKVIKAMALSLMLFLGIIFALVGLAQYLNNTVSGLRDGLGTILIGAVLIVLALFVRVMK